MAAKPTSRSGQTKAKSSNRAKSSNSSGRGGGAASGKSRATRASGGSTRASSAAARQKAQAQTAADGASNGFVGTIKQTASKAKGPAIAVGAAAVGAAGGALLRDRTRKKTVLGVPVPRSLAKSKAPDLDLPEMAKSIGRASAQFGQKTKDVSRDMERVGDRAERFGKMLS